MKPKYALLAGFLLFATVMGFSGESTPVGQIGFIMGDGEIYTPSLAQDTDRIQHYWDCEDKDCQGLGSCTGATRTITIPDYPDPLADLRTELDAMAGRIEELEGLLEYEYITKRQDVFVRILDAARVETNLIATDSIQQSSMALVFRQANGKGSMIIHHGLVYVPETLLVETLQIGETEIPEDLPARVLALEVEIKAVKANQWTVPGVIECADSPAPRSRPAETRERVPRRSR